MENIENTQGQIPPVNQQTPPHTQQQYQSTPPPFPPTGMGGYNPNQPIKPSNNLVWAILTTLFCCLPFGIVAIVKASQVDTLWFNGRFAEAIDAAKSARNWSIAAAVTTAVAVICYFIYMLIIAVIFSTTISNVIHHNDYYYG